MLSAYNPIDIEAILRQTSSLPPFPPILDREGWHGVQKKISGSLCTAILAEAERCAHLPIPPLPATLWLDFLRTGRREGYEEPAGERRANLSTLVIAECLQNQGRFLDPILNLAWAICEESSWAYPAHQSGLTEIQRPVIDLGAAMTALDLAELVHLLQEVVDPLLTQRIRDEMERRIFTPYLTRHDHWWMYNSQEHPVNNWTAVCTAGVAGAALYLEPDPARLAEILARAARSLDDYLATFDGDGGSSEGPGYWEYGFGYYTILAHLVEQRTGGAVNFLPGERLGQIAAYPLRTLLSRGPLRGHQAMVNFSDCDADVAFSRSHLAWLAQRMDLPELTGMAMLQPAAPKRWNLCWLLRDLFWSPPEETSASFTPARHDWFQEMMWMVARTDPADPNALVLAAKGGHNGEMHNQNDVGNLIIHLNGESVIADLGRGRYTRAYFGPERYEHLVNSSLGHSVPMPNGQVQAAGAEFCAQLLAHEAADEADRLVLDLTGVYPAAAELGRLQRQIVLHREAPRGWVELVDEVFFRAGPAPFENALTTFAQVDLGEGGVVLHGVHGSLRISYDDQLVEARLDVHTDVEFPHGSMNVNRVVFAWREAAQSGQIRLEIVPI